MDEPRYKVRGADHEYWREQIKCQYACPVHTDARGYVRAIAAGDYEQFSWKAISVIDPVVSVIAITIHFESPTKPNSVVSLRFRFPICG